MSVWARRGIYAIENGKIRAPKCIFPMRFRLSDYARGIIILGGPKREIGQGVNFGMVPRLLRLLLVPFFCCLVVALARISFTHGIFRSLCVGDVNRNPCLGSQWPVIKQFSGKSGKFLTPSIWGKIETTGECCRGKRFIFIATEENSLIKSYFIFLTRF